MGVFWEVKHFDIVGSDRGPATLEFTESRIWEMKLRPGWNSCVETLLSSMPCLTPLKGRDFFSPSLLCHQLREGADWDKLETPNPHVESLESGSNLRDSLNSYINGLNPNLLT